MERCDDRIRVQDREHDVTLWQGRFQEPPDDALMALSVSRHFDRNLVFDDLDGSRAHVNGLVRSGLLTTAEGADLLGALDTVEQEFRESTFSFTATDEDIHTAVERRVTELAGEAGAKLHTGRSRNDQIATDLRLFCRTQLGGVAHQLLALARVLLERSEEAGEAYLPGYTHLQAAQPVLLAHHLLAHGWALSRDVERLLQTRERTDVSPLGAGALAGSSLPLDPEATAHDLGFSAVFENSLDAVSDRDFVAEALFDLALVGVHLSRLSEEIILWTTTEFGFLRLDDSFATGSSMLPHKKNPDVAELARGKSGRLIGNLTGLLATLKGLPLAYNRDLQEDKEPLFDTFDQVFRILAAMTGLLRTATFELDRMQRAADESLGSAIDLAELLVERGVPFRAAHERVAGLVRSSMEGAESLEDLVRRDPELGPDAARLLEPGVAVRRRSTRGGAGPEAVRDQLARFRSCIAGLEMALLVAEEPGHGAEG